MTGPTIDAAAVKNKISLQTALGAATDARNVSPLFCLVTRAELMKAQCIEGHLFLTHGCSLVRARGCAKDYTSGRATGCISFLRMATQLVQKPSFEFVERQSVRSNALHRVLDVHTFGTDQKQSFLYPEQEQGSIVEILAAEHPKFRLLYFNIFDNIEILGR